MMLEPVIKRSISPGRVSARADVGWSVALPVREINQVV